MGGPGAIDVSIDVGHTLKRSQLGKRDFVTVALDTKGSNTDRDFEFAAVFRKIGAGLVTCDIYKVNPTNDFVRGCGYDRYKDGVFENHRLIT